LKKEKLVQLQLRLADKDSDVFIVYIAEEKTLNRKCPSSKKGTLITLLTFNTRGPPKNYKEIVPPMILKYST
jgi:hypothetical protein